MNTLHEAVSLVWPASGLAVGMLMVGDRRWWPGVAMGSFVANLFGVISWQAALLIGLGSSVAAVVSVSLAIYLKRVCCTSRAGLCPVSIFAAAVVAPVVSATVGVAALSLLGELRGQNVFELFRTWWVGDALGILGVAPAIVAARQEWRTKPHWSRRGLAQFLALVITTLGVSWLAFAGRESGGFMFTIFPLLLLATVWFGSVGATFTALFISVAGILAVRNGMGPFVDEELHQSVLHTQHFLAAVYLAALLMPQFMKRGNFWMPTAVMLVGWSLSGWMYSSLASASHRIDDAHFKELVADASEKVGSRASRYQDALQAGVGLLGASEDVERHEWAAIAAELHLGERFPGMLGIGLVTRVAPEQRGEFVGRMAKAWPGFAIKDVPDAAPPSNAGAKADAYVITYCEPVEKNADALGFDIGSDSNRKETADRACDSGRPAVSRRLKLVQDPLARAGVLLLAPYYRKGMVLETPEARRAACLGWVYAPVIVEQMLREILGRHAPELRMRVFEGESIEKRDLLFDTSPDASVVSAPIEVATSLSLGGQQFTLGWNRAAGFKSTDHSTSIWAGLGAAFISLLLALLVMNLQSTGQTARAMVLESTAELETTNGLLQREVNERLRIEKNLRGTNQLQQAILDSANYTIISTTREGVIMTFNSAAERLLGYKSAEVVGRLTPTIIHDRHEVVARAEALTNELGQMIAPGFDVFVAKARIVGIEEREWTYIRKDGTRLPVLLSVTTLRDEKCEITGYLGVAHDLTARKESEARVQRALDELAQQKFALDQHAIVAVTDVDGIITYVNDKFCSISGYTREELLGVNHRLLKSGLHSETFYREMYDTIRRGAVWQGELCNKAKNGTLYWEESTIVPFLGPDGKPTQYVAIRADITARKQLEESLAKARDEALTASRLKSEFLATMSHEIRTPMNGVIGMAGMLLQSPLENKQREMAEVITYSARNLLKIINDILDFSKIEAGKFRIDSADFNLRDAIEETVALLAPQASRKNLDLVCDISSVLATGVNGDRGRLQQVLTNLLGNSIKFTERGEVRITAQTVEPPGEKIKFRIEVEDTGVGIADAVKPTLFQPFVQADGSTTRKFGGTGLGLAISGQLVRLMGGSIDFESLEGAGSHFWFTLTLPHVQLPPVEALPPLPVDTKILVVDEHDLSRTILHRQLLSFGCQVDSAADADEAFEILNRAADRRSPHTVLLLDWNLPEETALRLARDVRRTPPLANLQIVVLCSATDSMTQLSDSLGLQAVLTKPVREVQLHRSLLRLRGMRETASPFVKRPSLDGRGLRLLMAEDNTTNQIVAQMMIEQLGHNVTVANNGQEAIDLLARNRYDAVLMDCQMPVLDGYETTRRIRSGRAPGVNPRIPIIALTAYAMPGDRLKVIDAGMDDYISKPFETEMLTAALARCGLLQAVKNRPAPRPAAVEAMDADPAPPQPKPLGQRPAFEIARREQLMKMKSGNGLSVWEKAVGIFMKEMPGRMQLLTQYSAAHDGEKLAGVAHTLVGSAANLGALALRVASAQLEVAAEEADWAEAQSALAEVELAWLEIQNELNVPVAKS